MSKQVYNWKRFWCPRSAQIDLGDRGYLTDPASEWGKHHNPELVELEAIADIPCLVLLGEPGIGKTRTLEAERNKISEIIHRNEDDEIALDLRSFGDENRLVHKLFENPKFINWIEGSHRLYVFLDSLDECLLRIDTVAALLADEFRVHKDKTKRLFLRITCRTAVWSDSLEENLKQIWGQDDLSVYELAPLRYADVEIAAIGEGIESQSFSSEVLNKNLVALAIKPVTLNFLLNTYKRNGDQFSSDQTLCNLYLEGCRLLCEESNLSRHGTGLKGRLESDQRLVIAARIAAVTVFANRFAIWTGINQGEVPAEDVLLRKLTWGNEIANGKEFEVTEVAIREVLDSGLFSSRGSSRMGWAHQTYAEFLAAWYLQQRNVSISQILILILHPDGRVVPQLQETVAWSASLIPEVFQEIMKTDPDILLQSDLAIVDQAVKESLVDSLLKLHDQGELAYQYRLGYKRLKHLGLSKQLQMYISDSTKSIHSRYVAIDIAEDCSVQAVQSNLMDIALDANQPYWVRTRAVSAVVCVGDEHTKARLKSLTIGSQDDLEDELKGYALTAVYPGHMTTEEVVNCLTQPKASYMGGRYQEFVAKEFGQRLPISDLSVALRWLEQQLTRRDLHYPFDSISDAIILKSWEHLEDPEVLLKIAQISLSRFSQYDELMGDSHGISFRQLLEKDDAKRRQLLEAVISIMPTSEREPFWLAGYSYYSILTPLKQDFLWLIEKLRSSDSDQVQRIYAKLIRWKLDWYSADQISAVLTASRVNSVLRTEFSLELESIVLNSSRADQAKLEYTKAQEMHTSKNKQNFLDPLPKLRVLTCLSQFEAGSAEAWWRLCQEMTLMPASTHYSRGFEADITTLPGWKEANEQTKLRIISAARKYIYQGEPETDSWLGTSSFRYSALAGYKALRLISVTEPNLISTIPAVTWKKWAAIILNYPNAREDQDKEVRRQLVKKAYQNASDEFIRVLIILIDQENHQHGSIYINQEVKDCWDERLAVVLLDKVQDKRLKAESLGNLLKDLLENQVNRAKVFAESLIPFPLPTTGEAREKAIVAAQMLMLYAKDAGWSIVWSAIQQDPEFGREVLEAVSYVMKFEGTPEQRLREDHTADLYIFLVQQYPDSDVKQQENSQDGEIIGVEAYVIRPEDSIRTWRDDIPRRLQERATPEAYKALQRIVDELPDLKDKLQPRLLEADALARRRTWKPPTPEDLFQLVIAQEPSNFKLSSQLEKIDCRTQKMADEPRVDQSIHITDSEIGGDVRTGNGNTEYKISPPTVEKRFDWKFWLSMTVTITVALISVAASGVLNDEIKKFFFKQNITPQVEQKLRKQTD